VGDGVKRAQHLIEEAEDRKDAATKKVQGARERHAAEVATAMSSGIKMPASGIRDARLDEIDAQDQLEAGQSALTQLQSKLTQTEEALAKSNAVVLEKAKTVLTSETTTTLTEVKTLMAKFRGRLAALGWLVRAGVIDDADPAQNKPFRHVDPFHRHGSPTVDLLRSVDFAGWAPTWLNDLDKHEAMAAWRETLEKLQRDPDATLPG
jgi:hypothetical protein